MVHFCILIGVIAIIIFVFACWSKSGDNSNNNPKGGCPYKKLPKGLKKGLQKGPDSLYNRLGGIFAISAVIDKFSDEVVKSPISGAETKNPKLREWYEKHMDRLPGLKFMRTIWVSDAAGGPFKFHSTAGDKCPLGLSKAHSEFQLSSEEFDDVARILAKTLDEFNVPSKEKSEVLELFVTYKKMVIKN